MYATPKSHPPTPGRRRQERSSLDNYSVKQALGEGAFSKVYFGYHRPSGSHIALKCIDLANLSAQYMKLCYNEVRLLKMVDSKNVVKCYEAFQTGNEFMYVALEYMDGGDLGIRIMALRENGKIFSERSIWYYFHQICNGLRDMHSKRILHRDLKPANVFLNRNGIVKLGDLGLSRHFSSKTHQAKTRVGTEYYMAPERNSTHGYHFKSDIWSLGCLLYEMCTLRSPFNGEMSNAYALHKKVAQGDYPPFPMGVYSRLLHHFTYSCLATDPEERPTAECCHVAARKMHIHFEDMLLRFKCSKK